MDKISKLRIFRGANSILKPGVHGMKNMIIKNYKHAPDDKSRKNENNKPSSERKAKSRTSVLKIIFCFSCSRKKKKKTMQPTKKVKLTNHQGKQFN